VKAVRPLNMTSSAVCVARTSSCVWSAIFSLERRPGLHARREPCRPGLRIHACEPGDLPHRCDGARARRVGTRLPRLAQAAAEQKAEADTKLLQRARTIHVSSRETYGVPRVHAELRAGGEKHGRNRIARLMGVAGLGGASRRRGGITTTRRDREARPAPDLVDRKFAASWPNLLWVADITFVPTASGFLYLAVVLDAWSRKIVGWAMANHIRAELVVDALEMALGQRRPGDVSHHSDQGSQLRFNRSSQQSRGLAAGIRQTLQQVSSSQGSCAGWC
jgi:transposase InsO family protein